MQLDNKERSGKIKVLFMLIPLLIIVSVALVYLITETKQFIFVLYGLFSLVLFFILISVLKFNFISIFIGPNQVRVRFKSLSPFNTPNNSVKLKPEQFHHYEIKSTLWGLRKNLILYINTPSGLAKYPPISMITLKPVEINQLVKAFELLMALTKANKV